MSATGRGAKRDPLDRYDTPAWAVHRLLDRVGPELRGAEKWAEPAVGAGAIVRAVDRWLFEHMDSGDPIHRWWLGDIAPRCSRLMGHVHQGDYARRHVAPRRRVDVLITNPPYAHAHAFTAHALEHAHVVMMLLRVGWLEGASTHEPERYELLRRRPPAVYVLPDRPRFAAPDGTLPDSSDATSYAWVVWGLRPGSWELLDTTPESVRCPKRAAEKKGPVTADDEAQHSIDEEMGS